ncbi:MAG: HEPN domain-containing protein [Caldilineaceae bacterium]|nr:HEPN domain-containing protein [Caldilineaceae bacterium]
MDDLAERWSHQAADDLETAKALYGLARYGPCAFFCQQAAEKALKAALYKVSERPWGHSIPSLLDQYCVVFLADSSQAPHAEALALDEHYMRPRYPDARTEVESDYDQEAALEALNQVQVLMAFLKGNVSDAGENTDD